MSRTVPHKGRSRRRTLLSLILTPMVLLALLTSGIMAVVVGVVSERQESAMLNRQAETVLSGLSQQLRELGRSKAIYAQLLAETPGLAQAMMAGDTVGLADRLLPIKVRLDIGRVVLYHPSGREIFRLGRLPPINGAVDWSTLVEVAAMGGSGSQLQVGTDGLEVSAVAPVRAAGAVVGVIRVTHTFTPEELRQLGGTEGVEIAVYRKGRLLATSLPEGGLRALLAGSAPAEEGKGWDNSQLHDYNYRSVWRQVDPDGLLVALLPTADQEAASRRRNLALGLGILALSASLAVMGFLVQRSIGKPVADLVATARELVAGNYGRRVALPSIRELNLLARAVNHLAERVEVQIAELTDKAFYDPLTRLPNRALFQRKLTEALGRQREHPVIVMVLDLDHFKMINDTLGHPIGDKLLVAVSQRLQQSLTEVGCTGMVCRAAGDEFTILAEGQPQPQGAAALAEAILRQFHSPFTVGGHVVFSGVSIGISIAGFEGSGPDQLVRQADLALYRAKEVGRANSQFFHPAMDAEARWRLELETELRRAVELGKFHLHYQPIYDLCVGEIRSLEALLRWEHPLRGNISPAEFIPLAEETGLIIPLGRWVLEEVCQQQRRWLEQGLRVPICVNLSARQVLAPDFIPVATGLIRESGIDPGLIEFEVTETIMLQDEEWATEVLTQLRAAGCRVALDDFGSGYSSLRYLQQLPLDLLKIDGSFVRALGEQPEAEAIVRAIIELAHSLRLRCIGESVETAEQANRLRRLGCDLVQGYYYSRPLAPAAIPALFSGPAQAKTTVR